MSNHSDLERLLFTPIPPPRPSAGRAPGPALAALAIGSLLALGGSWFTARTFAPALFPRWGYLLMLLLALWGAASAWLILPGRRRWLAPALIAAAAIAGALLPLLPFIPSGIALLASLALLPISAAIVGLLRLAGRCGPLPLLLAGYLPLAAIATLILSNTIATWQPPLPPESLPLLDELRAIERADQSDRLGWLFVLDGSRDDARLRRVLALDEAGRITTPEAQLAAALVLQHGDCPAHYRRAYELAHAAVRSGDADAVWLDHATYDRWMLATGRPQRYGTQTAAVDLAGSCDG